MRTSLSKHIFIISFHARLIDVLWVDDKLFLILELMESDLKHYIEQNPFIPLAVIKHILIQILNGLSFLHFERIFHRDLKPQNILINFTEREILDVKIVDFGLCRTFSPFENTHYTKHSMTPLYRAPEVFLGHSDYSCEVDIWSIGCIFAEMLTGQPLFNGSNDLEVLNKIFQLFEINPYQDTDAVVEKEISVKRWQEIFSMLDENGIDLISKMLTLNPKNRISASEALQHPFLKEAKN